MDLTAIPETIWIVLWGGAVAADKSVSLHLGLKEPLVAAGVTGWLLGYPLFGVSIGILLQLFWGVGESAGVRAVPDGSLGALAGTMVGACCVRLSEPDTVHVGGMALAFLGAHVFAVLAGWALRGEWWVRESLARYAESGAGLERIRIVRAQAGGLLLSCVKGFAFAGAVAGLCRGLGAVGVAERVSKMSFDGLSGIGMWGLCIGVAAGQFLKTPREVVFLAGGAVLTGGVYWLA